MGRPLLHTKAGRGPGKTAIKLFRRRLKAGSKPFKTNLLMKFNSTSLLSLSTIAIATLFFASSCKKDNNNTPSAGVSASVSGTAFTSAQAAGLYYSTYGFVEIVGYKISGSDSSAIYIQFNDTTNLNKPTDIGYYSNNGEVVWTDKGNVYDSWNDNSHGTMTVTAFDKTNKKLTGTFSGVFYASSGQDSVKVTSGTFNSTYISQ